MRLFHVSCESASVEDCIEEFTSKINQVLSGSGCYIKSADLNLTFGAFMHLSAGLLVDPSTPGGRVVAKYSAGRSRESAIEGVLAEINPLIENAEVVAFKFGTYTTPVTRRTYAVGVVAYNLPMKPASQISETADRRKLLAHVLSLFEYNPKVLNISELARVFGVSRDTIYYDIQQILKEKK
ncbi:HTH domain-containing protein [Thermococcus sp. AM4]|uniref:HTH domain-containing protein n=1 Tax=Thermococcus sp. (strain AM4) TaxID=246969 RepID=UPI00064F8D58|nr:HTH domain-containing protein [Thermococcus sp. AM4]